MTHAQFVAAVTDRLSDALDDYGVFLAPSETISAIVRQTLQKADEKRVTVDAFINQVNDFDEFIVDIRNQLLLEIAEERPGTDPWGHKANIPVPVSIVTMTVHTLSLCANLAISQSMTHWASHAMGIVGNLSAATTEDMFTRAEAKVVTMDIKLASGLMPIASQLVWLPQPGVATVARFLESVASRIFSGAWDVPEDEEGANEKMAANLRHEASMLRDLNLRFGDHAGPTKVS
jgi:energy-converting hydrogenase Eha subunit A